MLEEQYKKLTLNAVSQLQNIFIQNPNIFLTEDDVRCVLFQLLISKMGLVRINDGSLSSPIHSEVRWYGKNQNLHKRSDIVVLDASDLKLTGEGFLLPSKGFGFNNFYAVIEIKLRRKGGETDNVWLDKIKKDIVTLKSLRIEVENKYSPLLIMIAFDRKKNIRELVENEYLGVNVVYQSI